MRYILLLPLLVVISSLVFSATQVNATLVATQVGSPPKISNINSYSIDTQTSTPPRVTNVGSYQTDIQQSTFHIQLATSNSIAIQKPTPPTIEGFIYTYNEDTNQLEVKFHMYDEDSTSITLALMAIVNNNTVTLQSETTYNTNDINYDQTFTVNGKPSLVLLTYVTSDYPGRYPPIVALTLPTFILNSNLIEFNSEEQALIDIVVEGGYTITPIESADNMKLYAISNTTGTIGIVAFKIE